MTKTQPQFIVLEIKLPAKIINPTLELVALLKDAYCEVRVHNAATRVEAEEVVRILEEVKRNSYLNLEPNTKSTFKIVEYCNEDFN